MKVYKCLGYVYSLVKHQAEHKTAVCPCSKPGQWPSWMHQLKNCQQVKGDNLSPLLTTTETHLECYIQFLRFQHKKDTNRLESVQPRTTKMIKDLELVTYGERLRELESFSLEKRSLRLILSVQKYVGGHLKRRSQTQLYPMSRCNGHNLKYRKFHLNLTIFFYYCYFYQRSI